MKSYGRDVVVIVIVVFFSLKPLPRGLRSISSARTCFYRSVPKRENETTAVTFAIEYLLSLFNVPIATF
jgi:hypothetical protein